MLVKRAATAVLLALSLLLTQAPARADVPPPVGCSEYITPGGPLVVAGYPIYWGARHGVARVHSTVAVTPPTWGGGTITVSFAWKVGTIYTAGHHYYSIGWAAYRKALSVKVLMRTDRCGSFVKYYNFGVVGPPL